MADAFETGDGADIPKVLSVVARAKGVSQVACETGLSRGAAIVRSVNRAT